MKKVLLTGATGFIGARCIAPLIARGFQVYAVSSKPRSGAEWICHDLKKPIDLSKIKPTHLLHLAWYAEPPHFWHSQENIAWLKGSLDLFQSFLQAGGRRAVIAGTCAEYEWGHSLCHETQTPCIPNSLYGAAKYSLFLLAQKLLPDFAWGRLFHLYGPAEPPKKLIRSAISALLAGEKMVCASGEAVRDYLHVSDAADALVALLDSSCQGAVNIGSGKPRKIQEILETIGKKIGKPELIQYGRAPEPALIPSLDRLHREVQWKARIELNEGLDQMIRYFDGNIS